MTLLAGGTREAKGGAGAGLSGGGGTRPSWERVRGSQIHQNVPVPVDETGTPLVRRE